MSTKGPIQPADLTRFELDAGGLGDNLYIEVHLPSGVFAGAEAGGFAITVADPARTVRLREELGVVQGDKGLAPTESVSDSQALKITTRLRHSLPSNLTIELSGPQGSDERCEIRWSLVRKD